MLSSADIDLVRRDQALPGLSTVLDADTLLSTLRREAPAVAWVSAQISGLRYRPQRYCHASYRVDAGGADLELDVRACRREDLETQQESGRVPSSADPLGFGRRVIVESAVVVSVFPDDAELPQVGRLMHRGTRVASLKELLPEWPELWEGQLRCLRYWPGRRFTAELRNRNGLRVLLKAHRRRGYHRSRRNAEVLRPSGPLRVARLLGFSDRQRLLAFEWMSGQMLSEACVSHAIDWKAITTTGAALGWMHGQPPVGLECWTRSDEAAHLAGIAREIAFLRPGLAERVSALARRISTWLSSAPPVHVPVHGDLSDAQVLVHGNRAAIVDLDSARCSDPAGDLGSLLAQWELRALRGRLTTGEVESMRAALLAGYHASPTRSPEDRLDPYLAFGLLRRARFAFRARAAEWPAVMDSSVERAGEVLGARTG